jgi:prepilin-type N-terminal cleavage/methylation domain-containing protein
MTLTRQPGYNICMQKSARTRGFTLIEIMITVAITGVLAAVAIPAYMKYVRRSYTTEATMNLRVMYDGAVSYYTGEHSDSVGAILARQFPNSAAPTPTTIPSGVKHQPVATEYETPEWEALDFAVRDPYRYQYSFNSSKNGNVNSGVMMAQGDLDGDGNPSLFQRICTGTTDGVSGGTALTALNEIE